MIHPRRLFATTLFLVAVGAVVSFFYDPALIGPGTFKDNVQTTKTQSDNTTVVISENSPSGVVEGQQLSYIQALEVLLDDFDSERTDEQEQKIADVLADVRSLSPKDQARAFAEYVRVDITDSTGNTTTLKGDEYRLVAGSVRVVVEPTRAFRPGVYSINIEVTDPSSGAVRDFAQDFLWGVIAINTSKDVYAPGEVVDISIGLLNDQGVPVCYPASDPASAQDISEIELMVNETPVQVRSTGSCTTLDSGVTTPDYMATYTADAAGELVLSVRADNGNGPREASTRVAVEDNPSLTVEREIATRLYPNGESPAILTVVSAQDYSGQITERVPASFKVTNISDGGSSVVDDDSIVITWEESLRANQPRELSYTYDAPDVSPEFYLLGPAFVGDLEERRQWQIANDAIVGTDAFLQGSYVEIGLGADGGFGSDSAAPAGFHPRPVTANPGVTTGILGFVSDRNKDGWNTGTEAGGLGWDGDFFVPGSPAESLNVHVNGVTYRNGNNVGTPGITGGSFSNFVDTAELQSVDWTGSIPVGVDVTHTYTVFKEGQQIIMDGTITNNTGATLTDSYFMRSVDPDNNASVDITKHVTVNSIVSQGDEVGIASVSAADVSDGSIVFIVGYAENARVATGGFDNLNPVSVYNATGTVSNSSGTLAGQTGSVNTNDEAISLAFKWDEIQDGETVSFRYAYTLAAVIPPEVDLDADGSTGASTTTGLSRTYLLGSSAVTIADTDATITDADGTQLERLEVTLTNPQLNDSLVVNGTLANR